MQLRFADGGAWENLGGWLPRGTYEVEHQDRIDGATYVYRLRVLDRDGRSNGRFNELEL